MATPAMLLQTVFSALVGNPGTVTPQLQDPCANDNATEASASMLTTTIPPPIPANVPALIASLLSISALRDWLKLFIIGAFFEMCRRVLVGTYRYAYNWFFITAVFIEDDASYDWIMVWLSKQPSWSNARDVQISTRSFGLKSNAVLIPGEENDDPSAMVSGDRPLSYIPSYASSHSFWYKHRWCRVSRLQKEGTQWYKTKEEYLELCILSWDHGILNELLLEAKKAYKSAQENAISIYVSDLNHGWRHVTTRPKRPLSSIVLDPGIKDLLIEDARDFLESKNWYAARGIPFRRGYLLYGAPGSGKTSIIHSLAGELGLDIYIISLSRSGLDDNEKCIALMEDIDAAFSSGTLNRDLVDSDSKGDSKPDTPPQAQQQQQQERASKITLSGLLNALDGVGAQEGRILFATTNKYHSLDPALTRPGRMDLHIEFELASKYQARELYRCFYMPDSEPAPKPESVKPEPTEKDPLLLELDETPAAPSGTTTVVSSSSPSPAQKSRSLPDTPSSNIEPPRVHSHSRPKPLRLEKTQVDELGAAFSDALPERELSMASLQGYLMMYKVRPVEAVSDFTAWVEKERKEKREKEEMKKREEAEAKSIKNVNEVATSPTTTTAST
ncbi:P-loop containing nucleoside triphosphate hydrolase protein [Macrolepiota fuliginosa MF-IS2]|uniref:P-loop containing nucleoside triphosphate hydrolase protein n=1 Tax=Macrolepiota fuliginosa MF-IS2 TaxID=1400762 RepID=A0A9P5XEB1_9AGAR|nr:P-loop containing nucleoside triphosphate hydrolase protein [Macrolepiota fuliginosa MF-IS2]